MKSIHDFLVISNLFLSLICIERRSKLLFIIVKVFSNFSNCLGMSRFSNRFYKYL